MTGRGKVLLLGLAILVLAFTWTLWKISGEDWSVPLALTHLFGLAAVFYIAAAIWWRRGDSSDPRSLLWICLALYAPTLTLMVAEAFKRRLFIDQHFMLAGCLVAAIVMAVFMLVLGRLLPLRSAGQRDGARDSESKWKAIAKRPEILLAAGVVALALWFYFWFSVAAEESESFNPIFPNSWITAEYGLGAVAKFTVPLLITLAGVMILATGVVVPGTLGLLIVKRFRLHPLKEEAVWLRALGAAAVLLAIYSTADLYFGWAGFLLREPLYARGPRVQAAGSWGLAAGWLLCWLVVPLIAGGLLLGRRVSASHSARFLLLVYTAPIMFVISYLPLLFGYLGLFALLFLGLQFLAWGYLTLLLAPEP